MPQSVQINMEEKIMQIGLLSRLMKYGYGKAIVMSLGHESEVDFLDLHKEASEEKLFSEYRELTSLLHTL